MAEKKNRYDADKGFGLFNRCLWYILHIIRSPDSCDFFPGPRAFRQQSGTVQHRDLPANVHVVTVVQSDPLHVHK